MKLRRSHGFTLVELMIVIGIIILISALTIPLIQPMFEGKTLASGIIVIQSAVQHAMSEAARTGKVHYVSYNTLDSFQNMLVIYTEEKPGDWEEAWKDKDRRKAMMVGRPVLMTKGAKLLCVTKCMYTYEYDEVSPEKDGVQQVINGTFGNDSYLLLTPTGEIIPQHGEAFSNGDITWLDPANGNAINYTNPDYDTVIVGAEDFKLADKNDLTKFRHINLNLMTGDLFDEFD